MQLISFITSLINIGANSSWTVHPVLNIFMMIDGLIYRLVSYAFNVFLIMCSVNFNTLYGIVAPLLDRLKAVIMVLVLFKVGVALIQYMVTPDKAMSEGTNILKNIVIVAVLLVSYQFVFNVLNELSMLIMGNPTGYPYTTLSTIADVTAGEDEGLIMRALFGADKEKVGDVGDYLAFSTLSIFIHDYNNPESSTVLKKEICSSEGCDFGKVHNLSSKVDKTVEYIWGLSALVGLFLIYSIGKAAIEIGVRMFKLVILQMLAPVAIITIIDKGWGSSTWKAYLSKYGQVYIEAFTRMLFMLITTVFVCKFFVNIGDFFGNLSDVEGKFTKGLITIIVIISAYKIGGSIPKFIGEALGKNIGGSDTNFVGGLLGAGVGALTGAIAGGAANGLSGVVTGAVGGLGRGAVAGTKGNTVADFFKGQQGAAKGSFEAGKRAHNNENGFWGAGLGYSLGNSLGINQMRNERLTRQAAQSDEEFKNNVTKPHEQRMEDIDNELHGLGQNDQRMQEIAAAIDESFKSDNTAFNYDGHTVNWNDSDENIASTNSTYISKASEYEAEKTRLESLGASATASDYERLHKLQSARDTAYAQAMKDVKTSRDNLRDGYARGHQSELGLASDELTVSEREAKAKSNASRRRTLEEDKRTREKTYQEQKKAHEKEKENLEKRKIS